MGAAAARLFRLPDCGAVLCAASVVGGAGDFLHAFARAAGEKLRPTPAALVSTLGVTFLLVVPALVLGAYTAKQAVDATAKAQAALTHPDTTTADRADAWIKSKLPASMQDVDFSEQFRQGAEKAAGIWRGS